MAREMKHSKQPVKAPRKKSKVFRLFMLVWILVLAGAGLFATDYVRDTLVEMQANAPTQMVTDAVAGLTDDQIRELFIFNSKVDEGDQVQNIRDLLKDESFEIKQVTGTDDYGVFAKDKHLLTVSLNKIKNISKIGIFNYSIYELGKVTAGSTRELYKCNIVAPSDYKVYLGGKELEPDKEDKLDGFSDASKYVELPSVKYYYLDHLTKEPDLKITHNGEDVSFEPSEEIKLFGGYEKFKTLKEAGCSFDALAFAEDWSRFMTKDLSGTGRYGFNSIAKYFIKDSAQYKGALEYVSVIDITFISPHTLRNPAFTDKKVSNVVKYSDNVITCDVYLVKHMFLTSTRANRDDTLHSTLYLIKYNGEWKVVNMRSVV